MTNLNLFITNYNNSNPPVDLINQQFNNPNFQQILMSNTVTDECDITFNNYQCNKNINLWQSQGIEFRNIQFGTVQNTDVQFKLFSVDSSYNIQHCQSYHEYSRQLIQTSHLPLQLYQQTQNNILRTSDTNMQQTYTIYQYQNQQTIIEYQDEYIMNSTIFQLSGIYEDQNFQIYHLNDNNQYNQDNWCYAFQWFVEKQDQQEEEEEEEEEKQAVDYSYALMDNAFFLQQSQQGSNQFFNVNGEITFNIIQGLKCCIMPEKSQNYTLLDEEERYFFNRPPFYGKGRKNLNLFQNQHQNIQLKQQEQLKNQASQSQIELCQNNNQVYQQSMQSNYWLERQVSKLRIHDYQNYTRFSIQSFSFAVDKQE